jgi:uncharacterized protein
MDDRATVVAQLGRSLRSPIEVAARCHLGLPVVVTVPPLLDDGTPFPTRYWLTCPLARRRVGRLESAGGVDAAQQRVDGEPEFAAAYRQAMDRYATERDRLVPAGHDGPVPTGGVGGSSGGVKCLHAHYADHAAGNANPVGAAVAPDVEPLDCTVTCAAMVGAAPAQNPEWSEPRR